MNYQSNKNVFIDSKPKTSTELSFLVIYKFLWTFRSTKIPNKIIEILNNNSDILEQ